jgi:hypothetical protein
MRLDPNEARPLTDREIVKIIISTTGGLMTWCETDDIESALDHIAEHLDRYKRYFRGLKAVMSTEQEMIETHKSEDIS